MRLGLTALLLTAACGQIVNQNHRKGQDQGLSLTAAPAPVPAPIPAPKPTVKFDQKELVFPDLAIGAGQTGATVVITSNQTASFTLSVTGVYGNSPWGVVPGCSNLKKDVACTLTINARAIQPGRTTGVLSVMFGSATLATLPLSFNAVTPDVTLTPFKQGTAVVWKDGTAKVWGAPERLAITASIDNVPHTAPAASRPLPNASALSALSTSTLSGSGTIYVASMPVTIPDGSAIVDLQWVGQSGCALTNHKGDVWCWGLVHQFNPKKGLYTYNYTPEKVYTGATAIGAAGDMHCALDASGHMWCWGHINDGLNYDAHDGNGCYSFTDVTAGAGGSNLTLIPRDVAPDYNWDFITKSTNSLLCGKVQGENSVVCLGSPSSGNTLAAGDAGVEYYEQVLDNNSYGVSGTVTNVQVGESHVCIQSSLGGLSCTGDGNQVGQPGKSFVKAHRPAYTSGANTGKAIPVTKYYSAGNGACVVDKDNSPLCWGANGNALTGNTGAGPMAVKSATIQPGLVPQVSLKSFAQVGATPTVKSTMTTFSAATSWGAAPATVSKTDATQCYTASKAKCD